MNRAPSSSWHPWRPLVAAGFLIAGTLASASASGDEAPLHLILAARAYELEPLVQRLEPAGPPDWVAGLTVRTGQLAGAPIAAAVIGTGKVNATWSSTLLIERLRPDQVVLIGTAGGISPKIKILDIAIGHSTAQSDFGTASPDKFEPWAPRDPRDERRMTLFVDLPAEASAPYLSAAIRLFGKEHAYGGALVSGDTFSGDPAYRERLRRLFDPLTVDMESAAVAIVCERAELPLVVVRCATDLGTEASLRHYLEHQAEAAERTAQVVATALSNCSTASPESLNCHSSPHASQ